MLNTSCLHSLSYFFPQNMTFRIQLMRSLIYTVVFKLNAKWIYRKCVLMMISMYWCISTCTSSIIHLMDWLVCNGLTYVEEHQRQQQNKHRKRRITSTNKITPSLALLNSKALETHLWHDWTLKSMRIQKTHRSSKRVNGIRSKGLLQYDLTFCLLDFFLRGKAHREKRVHKSKFTQSFFPFFFHFYLCGLIRLQYKWSTV